MITEELSQRYAQLQNIEAQLYRLSELRNVTAKEILLLEKLKKDAIKQTSVNVAEAPNKKGEADGA